MLFIHIVPACLGARRSALCRHNGLCVFVATAAARRKAAARCSAAQCSPAQHSTAQRSLHRAASRSVRRRTQLCPAAATAAAQELMSKTLQSDYADADRAAREREKDEANMRLGRRLAETRTALQEEERLVEALRRMLQRNATRRNATSCNAGRGLLQPAQRGLHAHGAA
jgi:hypothetical protein